MIAYMLRYYLCPWLVYYLIILIKLSHIKHTFSMNNKILNPARQKHCIAFILCIKNILSVKRLVWINEFINTLKVKHYIKTSANPILNRERKKEKE